MDLSEAGSQGASPTNFIQDEAPSQTSEEKVEEEGGDLSNQIAAALKLRKERKVSKDQEEPTKKSQEEKRGDDRSESVSSQGGMGMQGK